MLQEAHANLGNKWAQITRQLNTGRPENAIKNRWNTRNKKTKASKVLGALKHESRYLDHNQPRRAYPEHPFVCPGGGGGGGDDKPHCWCNTGKGGIANDEAAQEKLWELSERMAEEAMGAERAKM